MIHISTVTFQHSSSDYFQVSVQFTYHKRYSYSTWEQTRNIIWSNVRHWRCRNISFFSSYWTKFSLKRIFSKSFITYFSLLKEKKLSHITQQVLTIDFFALENSQQIVNIDCTYVNFFFRRSNKAFIIGIIGIHVEGYIYI